MINVWLCFKKLILPIYLNFFYCTDKVYIPRMWVLHFDETLKNVFEIYLNIFIEIWINLPATSKFIKI